MERLTARVFAAALGLAVACAAGCGAGDRATSPEAAVDLLITAARTGDRAAVYRRLGPATRARIDGLVVASRKISGRVAMKPEDFLSIGWAPPAWDPSSVRTVRRDGDNAEVDVASAAGDRQRVSLVRENGEWKVELPGR